MSGAHWEKKQIFRPESFPVRIMLSRPRMKNQTLHDHEFTELALVISGTGIHLTETDAAPLLPGDLFGVLPGTPHGFASDDNLTLYNVLFDASFLGGEWNSLRSSPGLAALFEKRKILHLEAAAFQKCRQLIEEEREEEKSTLPGSHSLRRALLVELLVRVGRLPASCTDDGEREEGRDHIERVLEFMNGNYDSPLRLPQLVRLSRMSRTAFCVNFRRQTGLPPMEFLLRLRLERAKAMLRSNDCDVNAVAFRNGFSDPSYMIRQFRRIENTTPRKFRESFRQIKISE